MYYVSRSPMYLASGVPLYFQKLSQRGFVYVGYTYHLFLFIEI